MPNAVTVLMAAGPGNWARYRAPLLDAMAGAGLAADLVEAADPATVDYIVYAPTSALQDFAPFTRCKAVLSLWAGVERIVGNASLAQPLCRMVDPALTMGMVEWVVGHTLRHHLGLDRHSHNPAHIWDPTCPPLAMDRQVAMLGMGALGEACARALMALNFNVTGWSRSPKQLAGLPCLHGDDGLQQALQTADFVVTLLPKTADTENLLDARRLAMIKPGGVILNPGRGALIDDAALIAALDGGHLAHATLDVFRVEPLPSDHPFWDHPRITVTPHIAADTRPETSARVIAENIRRGVAGLPLLHLVDRTRGY